MIFCKSGELPKNTSCCYELQYCRQKRGTSKRKIVSVESIGFKKDDSLFVPEKRFDSFFEAYFKILDGGLHNNLKCGELDLFGINWYSPEKTDEIIEALKERGADSQNDPVLISWLCKAENEYNGFYFLGV